MSSLLIQERKSTTLSFAMPITAPSADVAWAFLQDIVPPTVFSSGSGRRRRKGATATTMGTRSEQGYLVFYSQSSLDQAPRQVALKSPRSIKAYLQAQEDERTDQWVALQTTQYRAGRNGQALDSGYTVAHTRHILAVVVDLDGGRMDPLYRQLLIEAPYAFAAAVDELLEAVGIESYRIVRSGPEGAHLYVPMIRPDGMPLRATEKNLEVWERVARGLSRYLSRLGADANAVRPTQPFVIPGLRRLKHDWIPYVTGARDGARANLYALLRRLAALKLIPAQERAMTPPLSLVPATDVQAILSDIRERAAGVSWGQRNQVAHDIAVYLIAKGAGEAAAWDALVKWNDRNAPPLSTRELEGCFSSAQACPGRHPEKFAEMQRARWVRLRGLLGLPTEGTMGHFQNGRWRPRTPAKPWEARKLAGGREHYHEVAERLLRFVVDNGPEVVITQTDLADQIGAAVSTLKEVLNRLQGCGTLQVTTKRGRNGGMVLSVVENAAGGFTENSQSRIAPQGVKTGVWVGPARVTLSPSAVSTEMDALTAGGPAPTLLTQPALAQGDPVGLAAEILRERMVSGVVELDWLAVWRGPSRCVLVGRDPEDRLLSAFRDLGYAVELGRRLGGVQVEVRVRSWRESADMREWLAGRDDGEDDPGGHLDG